MQQKFNALKLHEMDNVAVALENLKAGERLLIQGQNEELIIGMPIPYGHKIALTDIATHDKILKYGECMGIATEFIRTGSHVHVSNIRGLNEEDKTAVFLKGGMES